MHDKVKKVGGIIRAAREAKGITQAALSKTTGIAVRTIIDIEKEKRHPTFENLYKFINALDLPADQLFRPDKVCFSPEQEQAMLAVQSCGEQVQAMYIEIGWALVKVSKGEKGAKKTDGE